MAAELKIGIGADNSGLKQGLQDAEAQISAFVSKVGKIGQIGEQLSNIGQKMSVGLTLPIMALGAGALKAYGDIQSLQKGLEAVMGSADSASKEFSRLKEVAKLPGLGMEEAVKGSINLQAIGMDADKSRKILSQFGNAVASVGKGKAEFERAIYGVQQLANTDFPLGEDLNIIKDALPQVSNLLKEAFGTSRSDELAKMGVSSKQVLDTITAGLEKLPRVAGGIKGAFENLSDSMKTSLARIGKIIDDNFDISGIIDKLTGYLDTAISYFEGLSPSIQKTIIVFTGLVAAAGPLLIALGGIISALPTIITGVGALSTAFTVLTGPIGLVTVGMLGIVTAVVANWGKIKPYIEGAINWFVSLYNEVAIVRNGVDFIAVSFLSVGNVIEKVLVNAYNQFKSFGKAVLDIFSGIGDVIKGGLTTDLNLLGSGIAKVNQSLLNGLASSAIKLSGITSQFISDQKRMFASVNAVTKLDKVSLDNILPSSDEVAEKVEGSITKGIEKANKKIKSNAPKIELPDVDPIQFKPNFNFIDDFGNEVANVWNIEERFNQIAEQIANSTPKIITSLTDAQIAIGEQGIKFQEAIEGLIGEGVVEGLSQAFEAMGGAIAQGGNILQAAGGAILGVLGQFMQMLGKEMIKLAVATIALGSLVKGIKKWIIANPGAAIALAGIAIVAGTLLSAAGSNIGGGSSGGGGSVPSGGGGGSQSYSSSFSSGGAGGGEVRFRIEGNDLVGVLSRATDRNSRLNAN